MKLGDYLSDLKYKIVNDPLPAKAVAAGWALGMFIGCFVPFGLQLLVSVPLAFAFRVSKIGATVGTLVTNPITIWFIYPVQTWVGCRLLGNRFSWEYLEEVTAKLEQVSVFKAEGWRILSELGYNVLSGYFLGGLLLAILLTPPTYFIVKSIVVQYRKR